MPIRAGEWARSLAERFDPKESFFVYSMWAGYLERDPALQALLDGQNSVVLHASGHGSPEQVKAVCDVVRPRIGVIPIHTDAPEQLSKVVGPHPVITLDDGVAYEL